MYYVYIYNLVLSGEVILKKTNELAKAYALKSIYVFFSCLLNGINFWKFENSYAVFIGLIMFNGSCIVEHYFKYTYSKPTIILRRIGYLLPSLCIIIIFTLTILFIEFNLSNVFVYNKYTISVIIIVSIIQFIISLLDILLYGYNSESIKMINYTEKQINSNREKSAKVIQNRKKRINKKRKKYNRSRGGR